MQRNPKSSHARAWAFLLLATNMRWVEGEPRSAGLFTKMASCLDDPGPTIFRQCVQTMTQLVATSSSLTCRIVRDLEEIDPGVYRDSMAPLATKDVAASRAEIRETDLPSLVGDHLTVQAGKDNVSRNGE